MQNSAEKWSLSVQIYRVAIATYFSFWLFEAIASNLQSQTRTATHVSIFFAQLKNSDLLTFLFNSLAMVVVFDVMVDGDACCPLVAGSDQHFHFTIPGTVLCDSSVGDCLFSCICVIDSGHSRLLWLRYN
jgi:hypothetical protein